MKRLLSVLLAVLIVASLSVSAVSAAKNSDPLASIDTSITSDAITDASVVLSEPKDDVILSSDLKSFKGKFAARISAFKALRIDCNAKWSQLKGFNASIKTAWTTLKTKLNAMNDKKASKKISQALNTTLSPFRADIKASHASIKILRASKKAEWINFRTAIKAKDEAKASAALENITTLKTQIIEKQGLLISAKQNILYAITEATK